MTSGQSSCSRCPSCSTRTGSTRPPLCSTTWPHATAATGPACTSRASPTWSYDELVAAANRVAHVLVEDLGIVPGNRVLLRGPNNQWLSAAWFGVLKAGAVIITTMPLLRTGELRTIHEIAHLDAALVDHRFLDAVEPLGVPTLALRRRSLGRSGSTPSLRRSGTCSPRATTYRCSASPSGTTGRPKATMHFHRDLLAVCDTFSRHVLQPSPDDVFTGTPPFAFTFGLGGVLLCPPPRRCLDTAGREGHPGRARRADRRAQRRGLLHRAPRRTRRCYPDQLGPEAVKA